jgi:hypothetical protein
MLSYPLSQPLGETSMSHLSSVGRRLVSCLRYVSSNMSLDAAKGLKDYPGRLHFATDAWTSPNHRAFVAWTVHLQHEGKMLAFLLDFVEVPEVSLFSFFIDSS